MGGSAAPVGGASDDPNACGGCFAAISTRIVGKALKKKPAERYASVTALADDVRRCQRHEPIAAERPDTVTYRAAKFLRRRRWPVAAAVVVFTMLTAGLVVANRQRLIAESRFRQLRHLSDQVFGLDNRLQYLPGATEARQALVTVSLDYLEGLARDARGDLDLLQEVGDGYWRVAQIQGVPRALNLGNFVKAEDSLKKADGRLGLTRCWPRGLATSVRSSVRRPSQRIG